MAKKKEKNKGKWEKKEKTWNIEDTTYHNCPYSNVTVTIPLNLYDEIMKVYLYGLQNGMEVTIYAKIQDNCITDIYVPQQENGRASVDLKENVPLIWNCIIHSHPGEIKEFSYQDELTLLVNRDCCLLINQGKFTDGKYRIKMMCGSILYANVQVVTEVNGLEQKIKKKKEVAENFKAYSANGIWPSYDDSICNDIRG